VGGLSPAHTEKAGGLSPASLKVAQIKWAGFRPPICKLLAGIRPPHFISSFFFNFLEYIIYSGEK
jgi:hypothetical protein